MPFLILIKLFEFKLSLLQMKDGTITRSSKAILLDPWAFHSRFWHPHTSR